MGAGRVGFIKPFEYSRIESNLLAGRNPLTAEDIDCLIAEGVTHILDLREPREWTAPWVGEEALAAIEQRGLHRLHVRVEDMGAPGMVAFDQAVEFLETALQDPKSQVYVHCRAGMERTAAILVAWYARRNNVSYEEALSALRLRRRILAPLPNQERATRQWLKLRL